MTAASHHVATEFADAFSFADEQRASYTEYAPPLDLRAVVACTWTARVGSSATELDPVIADGCSDVIIVGGTAPHVAGPATRTHDVRLEPGSVIVGIRFRPGAARAAFGCDATELLDAHLDLHDVCGRDAARLGAELRGTPTTASARDAMVRWARPRLQRAAERDAQLVRAAHELVLDPRLTMSDLASTLGWSARRLHREFTATCGYGPKYLQRILRVQRMMRRARAHSGVPRSLSQLALDAGFADQAHMTRELRSLTGFTPRALLARGRHDVGRWLDAD